MQFRPIPLSVIAEYIPLTKAEGMAGYSTRAEYYGLFTDPGDYGNLGVMVAFTSIQYYSGKAKFNNHFVFKPFRGRGYFKQMLSESITICQKKGIHTIVATCTKMSLPEYLKRSATITKQYKHYTAVTLSI